MTTADEAHASPDSPNHGISAKDGWQQLDYFTKSPSHVHGLPSVVRPPPLRISQRLVSGLDLLEALPRRTPPCFVGHFLWQQQGVGRPREEFIGLGK